MLRTCILAIAVTSLGSGCASIVNGQSQSISIATPGCAGATCELNNDKGKWYLAATPGSVTVSRSYGDLFVRCVKGDLEPASQSVQSTTKAMAFGNIIFGGVIGAGIDMANGSAYDYPTDISLPLSCSAPTEASASGPVKLGCRVKEVSEIEGGVAGLPGTQGVFVAAVDPGSMADRAGLQAGDVLLQMNEVEIANSLALKELLASPAARQTIRIRYFRGGQFNWVDVKNEGARL